MFTNKKYSTLVAIAALTAGGSQDVRALRMKSDAQWHLAMVPDAFEQNNFISSPGRSLGFGFNDPFQSSFGFKGFDDDFPAMPSFGHGLQDMMKRAEEGGMGQDGQSYSSSSSSSYSSSMGADGKKHEKSSKQGQKKVCKDGECKIVTCKNGNCKEMIEQIDNKMQTSESKADFDKKVGNMPAMANVEQEMSDSFANMDRSMGQRMRQMEDGFQNMERNMAQTFKDLPNKMHDMAANGGDQHSQSYSSSFQQSMGKDGKVHKKESKQGQEMNCENGHCKETVCKNGVCHEKTFEEKSEQPEGQKQAFNAEAPMPEIRLDKPNEQGQGQGGEQGITKEQFKEIMKRIKEHVKSHGGNENDVVVKIVPVGKEMPEQKPVDNTPPPPPAFAPKDNK